MRSKIVNGRYFIDRGGIRGFVEVTKAEFDQAFPDRPIGGGEGLLGQKRPKFSDALACHPDDVKAFEEDAKKRGVPTDFAPDGRPVITSREHQKRYLKAYGMHNKDGGFGD